MDKFEYSIKTVITGAEDGSRTYEIRKTFTGTEVCKTAVIILLYPTVNLLSPFTCDSSTTYLLNRAVNELGYNDLRIVNIFDKVSKGKPSAKQLHESEDNIEYLKKVFEEEKGNNTDVIIAWGSTLKLNEITKKVKGTILKMIKDCFPDNRVKQLSSSDLETESLLTPHVLWMGLHCTDAWFTESVSVDYLLTTLGVTEQIKKKESKVKKNSKKATEEVVSETSSSES